MSSLLQGLIVTRTGAGAGCIAPGSECTIRCPSRPATEKAMPFLAVSGLVVATIVQCTLQLFPACCGEAWGLLLLSEAGQLQCNGYTSPG
jgi:hypothetical protein